MIPSIITSVNRRLVYGHNVWKTDFKIGIKGPGHQLVYFREALQFGITHRDQRRMHLLWKNIGLVCKPCEKWNKSNSMVILRNDPLLQVYRAIEADAVGTYKAGFLRLREVSATYTLSPKWVRAFGASAASLSVAGRNLSMLWTEQHGWNTSRDGQITVDVAGMTVWDPEVRAVGQLSNGYQTILPPTASFVTTMRLTF